MSFIGDIVGTVAKAVLPAVIDTVFPPAALFPGLTNMAANMVGDALGQAIDQAMSQAGAPKFLINDALSILKGVVSNMQQPCDPGCADHVREKYSDVARSFVDRLIDNFQDAVSKFKQENCGKGGKGGAAGPVTLRDLAKILGQLEQQEAQRVKDKVQAASDALGKADQAGTGKDGAVTQADNDKNAANKQEQFQAMEESKAEAQIFQALSSAISEVMKNFGGALNTASRGG